MGISILHTLHTLHTAAGGHHVRAGRSILSFSYVTAFFRIGGRVQRYLFFLFSSFFSIVYCLHVGVSCYEEETGKARDGLDIIYLMILGSGAHIYMWSGKWGR